MQSSRVRLMLVALLGVFAFSAVAAAAAEAEEAPFWTISETRGEGTGAKLETRRLLENETRLITVKKYSNNFQLAAGGKTITCSNIRIKEGTGVLLGSKATEPGKDAATIEFFENCSVTGNGSPCSVVEPITANVKSEQVESPKGGASSNLLTLFKPASGATFVTIAFTGTGCTVPSTKVTGEVALEDLTDPNSPPTLGEPIKLSSPAGRLEKSYLLNAPATTIKKVWKIKAGVGKEETLEELSAFTEPATLTGTALILLAHLENGKVVTSELKWSPLA
jgi:hypothetical protein